MGKDYCTGHVPQADEVAPSKLGNGESNLGSIDTVQYFQSRRSLRTEVSKSPVYDNSETEKCDTAL